MLLVKTMFIFFWVQVYSNSFIFFSVLQLMLLGRLTVIIKSSKG